MVCEAPMEDQVSRAHQGDLACQDLMVRKERLEIEVQMAGVASLEDLA